MASSSESRPFGFFGLGGTLFGIHIVNLFLALLTIGIYSFWGRVKIRKYIWGQVEFEGDRFSYHGTGMETFLGWVKAFCIFGIPYLVLEYGPKLAGAGPILIALGALVALFLVAAFVPMAVVGTRRYRLSRTAWRGIRFSFRETWNNYMPIFLMGNFLKAITLSLYTPYYDARRDKFLISNSYIGNQKFDYDGDGADLFSNYFIALILALPTLFISLFWYHVIKTRYVWNHTTLGEGRFNCTITFGGQFAISFVNALLVIFTLGFGFPWAQTRALNYTLSNLTLDGPVDLAAIQQDAQSVNATGEELSSFLELDFDLG